MAFELENESGHPLAGELIESEAMADSYAAAIEQGGTADDFEGGNEPIAYVSRFGKVIVRAIPSLPQVRLLNSVNVAETDVDNDSERTVDAAIEWISTRAEGYQVSVPPASEMLSWLIEERSFTPGYPWMKFGLEPAAWRPPEATSKLPPAREIGAAGAQAWAKVFTEGFGMPKSLLPIGVGLPGRDRWHCVAAEVDGQIAGVGALFVDGDVGWFGMGATKPSLRGRGAQPAVLAKRIELARELGCKVVYTETGQRKDDAANPSYDNILDAGFEELYLRPNLVQKPELT